ncbi:MAG: alanine--tRNA ligase [Flavobacteriales bacterium]
MTSKQIRKQFLDFFASKGHHIVPSAPMVVKGDPTLMFTNAGMNQFKDLFLGNSEIKYPRIANTQKCLRVSGKHNDLEEVGVDTYHHTMFEMLGNWSFGDYFKEEAISWAWELLTEVYKIPKDRLYVTVFEGDASENLDFDQEAYDIWAQRIDADRILRGNKKDNFWEMGDTGPCGPCSEIHVDIRRDEERAKLDGKQLVNESHPQVIEIWNNVFMQFNRKADGSLESLPAKHVDTGMGFERLCMVLQGKLSNYDTDVFSPTISAIEKLSGMTYERTDSKKDIAMRVISDHVRAVSFAIADGQLPSSGGAGYVIRRILRRAIRYGYSFLGLKESFIYTLVDVLSTELGDFFPEIRASKDLVARVIKEEEESFLRTLDKGISLLDEIIKKTEGEVIDGKTVFELYDTFGFPVDLTALIAGEGKKRIDELGFQEELNKQKERSRAATKLETDDWVEVASGDSKFVGYDHLESEARILKYRKIKAKGKEHYQLVLDVTPFYAESGGQVGDVGTLVSANDRIEITDTKKENNLIVHFADQLPENPAATFIAKVDVEKRNHSMVHHSATHLLHQALREVLGTHVEQKGSLVSPEYLRFDFSHFSKMTDEEIEKVESLVNERVRKQFALEESREVPIEEARNLGAMMLFGEKYGEKVRVIKFGESIELCGGTHITNTGNIGFFKITSEGAVAAGIRRIEAIAGDVAFNYLNENLKLVNTLKEFFKSPLILKSVTEMRQERDALRVELDKKKKEIAQSVKKELISQFKKSGEVDLLVAEVDLDVAEIKDIAFQLKGERDAMIAVFGSQVGGKPTITVAISDALAKAKNLNASEIVRELAKDINGGGGGQPFFATAGGSKPEGLASALSKAEAVVAARL